MGSAKKLMGGALGVLVTGSRVAGHLAWWLRYQMDGTTRTDHSRSGPLSR